MVSRHLPSWRFLHKLSTWREWKKNISAKIVELQLLHKNCHSIVASSSYRSAWINPTIMIPKNSAWKLLLLHNSKV
jgi:hypothetical protein